MGDCQSCKRSKVIKDDDDDDDDDDDGVSWMRRRSHNADTVRMVITVQGFWSEGFATPRYDYYRYGEY